MKELRIHNCSPPTVLLPADLNNRLEGKGTSSYFYIYIADLEIVRVHLSVSS